MNFFDSHGHLQPIEITFQQHFDFALLHFSDYRLQKKSPECFCIQGIYQSYILQLLCVQFCKKTFIYKVIIWLTLILLICLLTKFCKHLWKLCFHIIITKLTCTNLFVSATIILKH